MNLVFLELDTHRPHLDFNILDENNNEVILRTFYLQELNKDEHIRQWNKQNLSRLNPATPQEAQTYQLKKLTEIEAFFLYEIEVRE